jgi:hypothetical protein
VGGIVMNNKILTELPKWDKGNGVKEGLINWNKVVGMTINLIYNNEYYSVYINSYNIKKQKLEIIYNKNKYYIITGHFIECKFGKILGIFTDEFKYNVGDIIKDNKRSLKIIERVDNGESKQRKQYKYKCLKCGYSDGKISESNLIYGCGCPVCSKNPRKVVKGINDISTTAPWMIKYFKNIEDAYIHTYSSRDKVFMICPICGQEKEMFIYTLFYDGLSCICSDKISYPEKFLYSMLSQLNIDFKYQKVFNWSKKYNTTNGTKKYDFYIKINDLHIIIETNGIQHYEESKIFINTLYEEQENDKLKESLAKENGIEKYIIIDCRKSEHEFIKNNILLSELSIIFNLNNIDWIVCEEFACSSFIKDVCDLWNSGIKNTTEISKIVKIGRTTVCKYLKQGFIIKLCDYDPLNAQKDSRKQSKNMKKIICVETRQIYSSIKEATEKLHINNISACCRGVRDMAGGYHWMYYNDYLLNKILEKNKQAVS